MELTEFARLYYVQDKDTQILIVSLLRENTQQDDEPDLHSDTSDKGQL